MSGTAVFQSNTLATPGAGIVVATDAVNGTVYQQIKVDVGPAGTSVLASYAAGTGLPVQGVGTFQALGTIQPLAGSVHVANTLPGTIQALGSIQTVGTSQILGSVQTVGTAQVLGTVQPLAGSAHIANTAAILGSVSAQGYVAHGAAAAGNPVLVSAFGSSGTQVAVSDGQVVRLWSDLNGRLQVRGTIDSIGTIQALGSIQTVGTSQVLGSIQIVGTTQVLGSVQAVGTTQTKEMRVAGATTSSVAATVGNIILLAANPSRFGAAFYLESGSALYLKLGSNAGTLDYTVQMQTLGYYEMPFNYTGTVSGIWQFAGGTVRVTEIA